MFDSVSNFPITCIVADCITTTTKRSIVAMENYMSQQTGCKVFRVCARTQLNHQKFVLRVSIHSGWHMGFEWQDLDGKKYLASFNQACFFAVFQAPLIF